MAKLEGVKVLDMKYGEILRVEYGGEIYEKVDDKAKDGDIVQVVDGFGELISGDFAKVNDLNGFVYVYDGTGERAIYNGRPDKVIVFRKISVQPSLADRVTAVEAKLNDLSSRVDKLEGKTDDGYRLVTDREPRVGDYVKYDEAPRCYLTAGKYYEIEDFNFGDPIIIDDDGDEYDTCGDEFKVYEKVPDENVLKFLRAVRKPGEYKKGDLVRFKGTDGFIHGLKGYEGIITEVIDVDKGAFPIRLDVPSFIKTKYNGWSMRCDVELIAPVEARVDRP